MAYRPYTALRPVAGLRPTVKAPTGYAPGGYSYFSHAPNAAKRGWAPGGNYGYDTGGPVHITQTKPGAGSVPLPSPDDPSKIASTPGGTDGGGAGGGAGGGGQFPNDPVYQQIVGIANAKVEQAQAQATAARKQLAIEMGDPGLATSLGLGKLVSDTAQANPFSTLKNLLRGHLQNADRIDTSLNRANLFSSSTRGRQQQLEGTGYLGNVAGAQASAQKVLASILSSLLAAQNAAAEQKAAAARDAYDAAKNAEPPADTPPAATGSGPNGTWTQADAFAALLGQATKRANKPAARGPSGGV